MGEIYLNTFFKVLSILMGMQSICMYQPVSAQVKPDTVITIKDTLIKIGNDSIIRQERGAEAEALMTKNATERKKWQKLEKIFETDSAKTLSIIGFPIIAYLPETDWTFGGVIQILFRQKKLRDNHLSGIRTNVRYIYALSPYNEFTKITTYLVVSVRCWGVTGAR